MILQFLNCTLQLMCFVLALPCWQQHVACPAQVALSVGDDLLRPTLPSDAPEPVTNIALACFDPEPENRPSFALIVHHMRAVSDVGWSEASV